MKDKIFSTNRDGEMLLDVYRAEFTFPEVYVSMGAFTPRSGLYELYMVGMFRFFTSQQEYEKTKDKKEYEPILLPAMLMTKPSEVNSAPLEIPKGSSVKNMFILTYFKGDVFIKNITYVKNSDVTGLTYKLLDSGKADFLPYSVIPDLIGEIVNNMNDTKLSVGYDTLSAIVAERFRNPDNYKQKARFMEKLPEAVISLNARETTVASSTASMFGFEDVNSALMIAASRKEDKIVDKASKIERIILSAET
jgi:hypothetical protein